MDSRRHEVDAGKFKDIRKGSRIRTTRVVGCMKEEGLLYVGTIDQCFRFVCTPQNLL